jgi:hypothetical protein
LGELTGDGEAAEMEFDGDGGSSGAPAGGDPSSRRCSTPVAASPAASDGGKKQRRRHRWNWAHVRGVMCCGCKREAQELECELK